MKRIYKVFIFITLFAVFVLSSITIAIASYSSDGEVADENFVITESIEPDVVFEVNFSDLVNNSSVILTDCEIFPMFGLVSGSLPISISNGRITSSLYYTIIGCFHTMNVLQVVSSSLCYRWSLDTRVYRKLYRQRITNTVISGRTVTFHIALDAHLTSFPVNDPRGWVDRSGTVRFIGGAF